MTVQIQIFFLSKTLLKNFLIARQISIKGNLLRLSKINVGFYARILIVWVRGTVWKQYLFPS